MVRHLVVFYLSIIFRYFKQDWLTVESASDVSMMASIILHNQTCQTFSSCLASDMKNRYFITNLDVFWFNFVVTCIKDYRGKCVQVKVHVLFIKCRGVEVKVNRKYKWKFFSKHSSLLQYDTNWVFVFCYILTLIALLIKATKRKVWIKTQNNEEVLPAKVRDVLMIVVPVYHCLCFCPSFHIIYILNVFVFEMHWLTG